MANITIASGGNLNISDVDDGGDGIHIHGTANLTIAEGGNLNISDIEDGIYANAISFTIDNSGTITFGADIDDDFIDVNDGDFKLINRATGLITNTAPVGDKFLTIDDFVDGFVHNYGSIVFDMSGGKGFYLGFITVFTNHSGGTIQLSNTDDEAIEIIYKFINDGLITVNGSNEEGLDLDDPDAHLTNNGTITLLNINGDAGIDIQGTLDNNGIINIGHVPNSCGGSACEAIFVDSDGDKLLNNVCGIINITTADSIVNNMAGGLIQNLGIITTVFTGSNRNSATFVNNGFIHTPTGTFNVVGNPVTGSGSVKSGPIPASTPSYFCPLVPTVSQWGLVILSLFLLILAVGVIKSRIPIKE